MHIELWELSRIRPYENNPRLNDDAVAAVAASIREFGFRQPIVVDAEGVIIVGHTRFKGAQHLGLERVPVHVATDLTPAQVKAYRLADNQTATLAEWNYDLLPIELADLQGMNYDLGLIGFSTESLAEIMDPGVQDGLTDPDDVPEPPDEATTQAGRPVDSRRPPSSLRRQLETRRRGPAARWRPNPPREHGPALQRQGRAAEQ